MPCAHVEGGVGSSCPTKKPCVDKKSLVSARAVHRAPPRAHLSASCWVRSQYSSDARTPRLSGTVGCGGRRWTWRRAVGARSGRPVSSRGRSSQSFATAKWPLIITPLIGRQACSVSWELARPRAQQRTHSVSTWCRRQPRRRRRRLPRHQLQRWPRGQPRRWHCPKSPCQCLLRPSPTRRFHGTRRACCQRRAA